MDKSKLLAALREETLPRIEGARTALMAAQHSGDAQDLAPVRELCHRAAGTAHGFCQMPRKGDSRSNRCTFGYGRRVLVFQSDRHEF